MQFNFDTKQSWNEFYLKPGNFKIFSISCDLTVDLLEVLSRFKMLLAVPATIGEAEDSSRSSNSKDHLEVLR